MSSEAEENKAIVRRFLEEWAKANYDIFDELLAPEFVDRSLGPGQQPDREEYKRSAIEGDAPFSDLSITIDHQMAEGDKVMTWYTGSSTHDRGPFMGVPPSGRRSTFTRVLIHRVVRGKILEEWSHDDPANILQPALEQELRQRERVEQELQVARRIQHASLPKEAPALEGWQFTPYYRPAREVGGDFYDFHLLSEGHVGLVVGDATGKGVPAALVMSSTRSMLRAVARASNSPGEVLEQVNDLLVTDIPPNMFVTCFYAVLEPNNGRLVYANAGHDLPYWRRNVGGAKELRARGMPLGLLPGMGYEEDEIVLKGGESVLFYSDGLVEAHEPKGEMFGFPRLRALVGEHGEEQALGEYLMEELYSFVGEGWEQEDDITLLTLQRNATLG